MLEELPYLAISTRSLPVMEKVVGREYLLQCTRGHSGPSRCIRGQIADCVRRAQ